MADFPPNLEDGELWLPSDILPDDVHSRFNPRYCSKFGYMEDLAHRFAALALLDRRRNQVIPTPPANLAPYLEFREPVRYNPSGSLPYKYSRASGGLYGGRGLHYCGDEGLWTGSTAPVSHCQFVNPVRSQFEGFLEARARVLQRHQDGLMHKQLLENQFLSFQGSGVGLGGGGGGGGLREYGGTGVFLPRISSAAVSTRATATEAKKRKSVTGRHVSRVFAPRNSIQRVDGGKSEECHCQLPPELGLPPDWTY